MFKGNCSPQFAEFEHSSGFEMEAGLPDLFCVISPLGEGEVMHI